MVATSSHDCILKVHKTTKNIPLFKNESLAKQFWCREPVGSKLDPPTGDSQQENYMNFFYGPIPPGSSSTLVPSKSSFMTGGSGGAGAGGEKAEANKFSGGGVGSGGVGSNARQISRNNQPQFNNGQFNNNNNGTMDYNSNNFAVGGGGRKRYRDTNNNA
jgi:hypothetical protein